jgi:poly(3-hydroxybutyrate) depolymerase
MGTKIGSLACSFCSFTPIYCNRLRNALHLCCMKTLIYLLLFIATLSSCDKTANEVIVYHFTDTISVDGRVRNYLLNLPPNYNTADNFSLVVALHGFGGQPTQMETDYHLTQKSNSAQFVIVYPEGTPSNGPLKLRSWNAGNCCDLAQETNVNDVGFISRLIAKLTSQYKIDAKKVYVTGMSNGAMMTCRLACELPHQIAAIANSCINSTTVTLHLTKDGGHSWPGGAPARPNADAPSKAFNATDVMWDFFQRYELP